MEPQLLHYSAAYKTPTDTIGFSLVEFQFLHYFKLSKKFRDRAVVPKLRLHAAEAGGVLDPLVRWVVQKLSLHNAKESVVSDYFSQLRQRMAHHNPI
jgi:hypothetical protein